MEDTLITTHFVKNFDLGANGNLYGGRLLDWLDESGALFVHQKFPRNYFVTWKIGETIFHRPVKEGEIVSFFVSNVEQRKSSVGLNITVKRNNFEVLTSSMVFVCVDKNTGEKKEIENFIS